MRATLHAALLGGPRCGAYCEINPDAAPAVITDMPSGGHYGLTERVTYQGEPIYVYEPFRAASEAPRGPCRCGCRRGLGVDA